MRKSSPLFIAITKDKKQLVGTEDYLNPGWKEIPEGLDKVFYRLPDSNYIVLQGYDKYFYGVNGCIDIIGNKKGQRRPEFLYFMGKKGNIVDSYRITLFNRGNNERYKVGDITKRQYSWKEMSKKYRGWK